MQWKTGRGGKFPELVIKLSFADHGFVAVGAVIDSTGGIDWLVGADEAGFMIALQRASVHWRLVPLYVPSRAAPAAQAPLRRVHPVSNRRSHRPWLSLVRRQVQR
jgi:hypothetical protein